jgi:hypothetical protein
VHVSLLGTALLDDIFSIGQDTSGELYALGVSGVNGGVYAVVPELPGDFNHDKIVNGADYIVWRKTSTNVASYNLWRANYGNIMAGTGAQLATVAEPTCIALFMCGLTVLLTNRRRRSS